MPDPNIFLWIAASVAAAAPVNSNGIKTLLANYLSIFPIKGNQVFSSSPKSLLKNLFDSLISCNWVFDSFILAEELFTKVLQGFKTCVLVNNNLCVKLYP